MHAQLPHAPRFQKASLTWHAQRPNHPLSVSWPYSYSGTVERIFIRQTIAPITRMRLIIRCITIPHRNVAYQSVDKQDSPVDHWVNEEKRVDYRTGSTRPVHIITQCVRASWFYSSCNLILRPKTRLCICIGNRLLNRSGESRLGVRVPSRR